MMALGREGYLPGALGRVHPNRKTPINALGLNMLIGFGALLTGKTGDIITLACFGALTLYTLSMLSLFKLRRDQPELKRPYQAPLYPAAPLTAFCIATLCLVAMTYYNPKIALVYAGVLGVFYIFSLTLRSRQA